MLPPRPPTRHRSGYAGFGTRNGTILKDIAEYYEADKKKINLVMPIPGTIIVTPQLPDARMKGADFKLAERGPVEWIMRVDSDAALRSGKLV